MWQNLFMRSFSKKVEKILSDLRHTRDPAEGSSNGVSAAFECGASLRFLIDVDAATKTLRKISYETNGCGYMIAASETITRVVKGRTLTDLRGASDLDEISIDAIGPVGPRRLHCVQAASAAFRSALANYRSKVVEEFHGEKALICTCFGVTEETILNVIKSTRAVEVSDVSAVCRAGTGCGSCRMLIQELIDGETADFAA